MVPLAAKGVPTRGRLQHLRQKPNMPDFAKGKKLFSPKQTAQKYMQQPCRVVAVRETLNHEFWCNRPFCSRAQRFVDASLQEVERLSPLAVGISQDHFVKLLYSLRHFFTGIPWHHNDKKCVVVVARLC